jgi:hypothetical protein
MEVILSKSVCDQERWVSMTKDFLPAVMWRVKAQKKKSQRSLKEFLGARWSLLHLSFPFSFHSRRRLKPKQASGFYTTKTWSPGFRAAGVITTVSF